MASPASSASASLIHDFDVSKIEREVNAALQAAANGTLHPKPVSLASLPLPSTTITEKATKYAYNVVDPSVFAHCLRTYYFGAVITTENFPDFGWNPETFYLASILHDVGCTHNAFRESIVSFELYGGMVARKFLLEEGTTKHVADTVMEAICRHKDGSYTSGGFSPEGQMLRFGAQLDTLGNYSSLINTQTFDDVVVKYPRNNFNNVFADLLVEEIEVKHYCTGVSALEGGLIDLIRNNPLFAKYDQYKWGWTSMLQSTSWPCT